MATEAPRQNGGFAGCLNSGKRLRQMPGSSGTSFQNAVLRSFFSNSTGPDGSLAVEAASGRKSLSSGQIYLLEVRITSIYENHLSGMAKSPRISRQTE